MITICHGHARAEAQRHAAPLYRGLGAPARAGCAPLRMVPLCKGGDGASHGRGAATDESPLTGAGT